MDQVKKPATISFIPLKDALVNPEPFMETDFAKIGRPGVLHQAFRGLDKVLFSFFVDPIAYFSQTWCLDWDSIVFVFSFLLQALSR